MCSLLQLLWCMEEGGYVQRLVLSQHPSEVVGVLMGCRAGLEQQKNAAQHALVGSLGTCCRGRVVCLVAVQQWQQCFSCARLQCLCSARTWFASSAKRFVHVTLTLRLCDPHAQHV